MGPHCAHSIVYNSGVGRCILGSTPMFFPRCPYPCAARSIINSLRLNIDDSFALDLGSLNEFFQFRIATDRRTSRRMKGLTSR